MPPRLPLRAIVPEQTSTRTSISSFLLPFLYTNPPTQIRSRHASILSSLSDTPGSYSRKIRRGRGPSSGKGKTSGRGHKGQKQHGKVPTAFQGGQTPDAIVHGKEGFKNAHTVEMSPINLDTIQTWISAGRLDASRPITLKELSASRAVHGIKDGIKLLARGAGALTTPVHIVVSRASEAAIAAVEACGGSVVTRYYTPLAIRHIKQGAMHTYVSLKWDAAKIGVPALSAGIAEDALNDPAVRIKGLGYEYRLPDPTGRKDMEYYRDAKNRGYLAHEVNVEAGEGPSLYFKPMPEGGWKRSEGKSVKERRREENRLW